MLIRMERKNRKELWFLKKDMFSQRTSISVAVRFLDLKWKNRAAFLYFPFVPGKFLASLLSPLLASAADCSVGHLTSSECIRCEVISTFVSEPVALNFTNVLTAWSCFQTYKISDKCSLHFPNDISTCSQHCSPVLPPTPILCVCVCVCVLLQTRGHQ